jgi:hypothetical protein
MRIAGSKRQRCRIPSILLLVCGTLIARSSLPAAEARRPASPADLDDLLEQAAAYCDRLSQTVMDFVCRERVEEWLYPRAGLVRSFARPRALYTGRRETHRFVYDYQLIRDRAGAIRETRTLLKKDKKDLNLPGARLETRLFWHSGIVMGPLGLLSREKQKDHDYRVLREDRIGDERAFVVEAVPKPGARSDHLIGTVWLRLGDGGVLKIEWDPASIENYTAVEQTAARFEMEPRIVMTSEFAFEKNGIRFPSRFTIKEIYKKSLLRFERSEIDVLYDQYKFFTVETRVKFEK